MGFGSLAALLVSTVVFVRCSVPTCLPRSLEENKLNM